MLLPDFGEDSAGGLRVQVLKPTNRVTHNGDGALCTDFHRRPQGVREQHFIGFHPLVEF